MQKTKLEINSSWNGFIICALITTIFVMLLPPDFAHATVESSIKGVGSSLQKVGMGCALIGLCLGAIGMMFGVQWGMRTIIGSMLGTACILGGNSIISFFSTQIH